VRSELGLSLSLSPATSESLREGYALERVGHEDRLLALIVTIGEGNARQLLQRNLEKALTDRRHRSEIAFAEEVWLPLMGVGAGGLDPIVSLRVTLSVIGDMLDHELLRWRTLRISLGVDFSDETVRKIADYAKAFFAATEYSVVFSEKIELQDGEEAAQSALDEPSSITPLRAYKDDLPTQVDAPSTEPKLGFPDIAKSIVAVVEETVSVDPRDVEDKANVRQQEWLSASDARLTVGIFAPWGAGKSTLINALRSAFLARQYPVFMVNPWKWDGKGDLHDFVRSLVVDQAGRQGNAGLLLCWLKLRTFWRSYRARIWWAAFVVTVFAVFYQPLSAFVVRIVSSGDSKAIFGELLKAASLEWLIPLALIALPTISGWIGNFLSTQIEAKFFSAVPTKLGADGLSLVYRDIATLIYRGNRTFRPFIFFVDDLDRCSPERVAVVLESVHSLTAAGCVVFLACDDEYVVAALNAHYEKVAKVYGDGKVFGRRYLEKIVQIPFRLPLLRNQDVFELGIARQPSPDPQLDSGPSQPAASDKLTASHSVALQSTERPALESTVEGADRREGLHDVQLQEIVGDILGYAVEPLGLNVRQAKSLGNTLKLYLRICRCRTESEARQVAAFVFADRLDARWLDAQYHGVVVSDSAIGMADGLAARLASMIGDDRQQMLSLYHLLGRRPGPSLSAMA